MAVIVDGTSTSGQVPLAADLDTTSTGSELFINNTDGLLFFKNSLGEVKVLASTKISDLSNGNFTITSGSIDSTPIGLNVPSTGQFTTLGANTLTLPLQGLLKSRGVLGVTAAQSGVDYLSPSVVGIASGVASLDNTGKVPFSQLPTSVSGGLHYMGTWNASTNTPVITSGIGTLGSFYKVAYAGNTVIDGQGPWSIGDELIFNGTVWSRIPAANAQVVSVNGLTGTVNLTLANLGAAKAGANSDITSLSALTTALLVPQGGTGRTSLSGILKGNGTSAISSAVAGVDYAAAPTGTIGQLIANNGSGGFANVKLGSGLHLNSGVLSATLPALEAVTRIDASGGTTGMTFTGGPITDEGTFVLTGTLSVANGGTGSSNRQDAINTLAGGVGDKRFLRGNGSNILLDYIKATDIPTLNQNTTGTAAKVTDPDQPNIVRVGNLQDLTVSGSTYLGSELVLNATSGTSGQVLVSQGAGSAPKWTTLVMPTPNTGTVTSVNASGGATGLSFSGGPITSSGTLTLSGVLDITHGGTGTTVASGSGPVLKQIAPLIQGPQISDAQINNSPIGTSSASSAKFTTVSASSATLTTLTVAGDAQFNNTKGVKVAVGTTSQRPTVVSPGLMRFNSELDQYEGQTTSGAWIPLGITPDISDYVYVSSNYTANVGQVVAVNTTFGHLLIKLPLTADDGDSITILDVNDFSVNGVTIDAQGGTINGELSIELSSRGTCARFVRVAGEWLLYGNDSASIGETTGNGARVLANSPTLITPNLGVPSSVNLTNATGLPLNTGVVGILPIANGGTGVSTLPTGILKGGAVLQPATAGVDYAPPVTVPYGQLLSGDNSGGTAGIQIGSGLELDNGVLKVNATGSTSTGVTFGGGTTGLSFHVQTPLPGETTFLEGVLKPSAGGTGATGLNGFLIANGDEPMTAAVPGVDYAVATTGTTDQLLANNGDGGFANVSVGSGLFLSNGILTSTSGVGSVTWVNVDASSIGLHTTGGPVIDEGTLTLSGVINAASGGTGTTGITGIVKGNGVFPMSAAEAGVDYAAAPTGSVNQLLANNGAGGFKNLALGTGLAISGNVLNVTTAGAGGGVTTFNGRTGIVLPVAGDYSASQITVPATSVRPEVTVGGQLAALTSESGSRGLYHKLAAVGSVTRMVESVLAEHLSVTDFGADKSGVADSTSAFASAYNAAVTGQTIFVPSGTFVLSSSVGNTGKVVLWEVEGDCDTTKLVGSVKTHRSISTTVNGKFGYEFEASTSGSLGGGVSVTTTTTVDDTVSVQARTNTSSGYSLTRCSVQTGNLLRGLELTVAPTTFGAHKLATLQAKGTNSGTTVAVGCEITTDGAQITKGISLEGDIMVGLDLSLIGGTTAIRLAQGKTINFTADDKTTLGYTSGGVAMKNNGTVTHMMYDNGDLLFTGQLVATPTAMHSSAGAATGTFLGVMIGGTLYKIALQS